MENLYQFCIDWNICKPFIYLIIAVIVEVVVIRCYKYGDCIPNTLFGTEEETIFDKIAKKRSVRYEMSIIGLCFTVIILLYVLFNVIYGNFYIYQKFHSDDFNTVTGKIYNFEDGSINKEEAFCIDDVQFSYDTNSWGYHKFKADGGVISGDGQQLVIGYVPYGDDNIIVYIAQDKR